MNIDKIEKMKSGKYKIVFDDESKLLTYDDVILKNNLLFSKEVDSTSLNQLNIDTNYYNVYDRCLKYIGKRLRSEKEMMIYLGKLVSDENIISKIIGDLKRVNLINDEVFVSAYIKDRLYLSNDGPLKIKNDLIGHNINESIILNGLTKIDDEMIRNKLDRLIKKKIKLNHKYSNYMLKQRIYRDMVNLGYDGEMINICFDNNVSDDKSNLVKEFEKLYNKYSADSNWMMKIRQKLYQKGYGMAEIDSLINEKIN